MIFSHRLEPDHHFEEYIAFDGDESDTDFIQPPEDEMSDETIIDIYNWLIWLEQ